MAKKPLGALLVEAGLIDALQLRSALGRQRDWGKSLGRTLVDMDMVDETTLVSFLARQLNLPAVALATRELDTRATAMLDLEFCRSYECLPFGYSPKGRFLDVAMADPTNLELFEQVRIRTRCNVRPFLAGPNDIARATARAFDIGSSDGGESPWMAMIAGEQMLDPEEESQPAPPTGLVALQRVDSVEINIELDEAFPETRSPAPTAAVEQVAVSQHGTSSPVQNDSFTHREASFDDDTFVGSIKMNTLPPGGVADLARSETLEQEVAGLRATVARMQSEVDYLYQCLASKGLVEPKDGPPALDILDSKTHKASHPPCQSQQRPVVVIDFGTSRSSAAALIDGKPVSIAVGDTWDIPSVVGYLADGATVVGDEAYQVLAADPSSIVVSPKRLLGRKFRDRRLEPYLASLTVATEENPEDGSVLLRVQGQRLRPAEVCAEIIDRLRFAAEQQLQQSVRDVILTAPGEFDEAQYEALTAAASLCRLNVTEFVQEPVAAAFSNFSDASFGGIVAVYDFGGGTFDFSVVNVGADDVRMLTTAGDSWLGGDDFDQVLANAAANAFWRDHNVELRHQAVQWQRLLLAAEQAKRQLSISDRSTLELSEAALTRSGALDLGFEITRGEFARMTSELVRRSLDTCREALASSELHVSDISTVYLSGGTSQIPAVRDAVTHFFGKAPRATVAPDRAVVLGAAMYGSLTS